jgi:peroxiredoxin
MLRRLGFALPLAAVALALVSSSASAGKFNKVLSIGDDAPDFSNIIGTDDDKYGLDSFKDAKAIVVVFTCNNCPVAVACEDRIVDLQKDYKAKGVQVVAINVNNVDGDRLDSMKERASSKNFNFPYLYDPTQKVARDYGAGVTPDVVVLDKDRKVAYLGLLDDEPLNESAASKHYVRDALDAVLSGSKPAVSETKAKGCGIKFE